MALDPFFQQGMNAWTARNQAQSDRASKLNQLVQTGQMKDLLQRTGHQQKLAEADRTGEWGLADRALGKNLLTTRAATQFPGSQATGNIANIQHGARIADSAQKMGGFPGFAEQIGQFFKNPAQVLGETGVSPEFEKKKPGAEVRAELQSPIAASLKDQLTVNEMVLPDGSVIPGIMRKRVTTTGAKSKATTPGKAAQDVRKTLDLLRTKGTVTSYTEGISRKTGKPLFRVVYSDGRTVDLDDLGKSIKKTK
jgi:hypothetical protein